MTVWHLYRYCLWLSYCCHSVINLLSSKQWISTPVWNSNVGIIPNPIKEGGSNGKNRIDEFINKCKLNGWIVNRINNENQLDIYTSAEEEIKFE